MSSLKQIENYLVFLVKRFTKYNVDKKQYIYWAENVICGNYDKVLNEIETSLYYLIYTVDTFDSDIENIEDNSIKKIISYYFIMNIKYIERILVSLQGVQDIVGFLVFFLSFFLIILFLL
jgi:hypothetical protein